MKEVERLVKYDPAARAEYETVGEHGGDTKSSLHVNLNDEQTASGNSRAYRIAVLKRDASDIAERVIT